MKLLTRAAVALVLCSAAFITSAEAQAGAAKQKEDPCAALARLSGIGKDSSAAIARCINKGSGQVPVGEYLVAKSVIITKPKASLSTAGVAPDSPRCSGKLPCARFQRAEKFRSGSMFAFSGKSTAIRHVVLDGAQERLAAPLQQKGSLLALKGCRECSLSSSIVQSSLGNAAVALIDSSVEISNNFFFGNGSAAAVTDGVSSTNSSFSVIDNLFVNNAGLNVKAATCRSQCIIAQNVVTYLDPAVPVPAAMLLRGGGYAVLQNYINCSAGGCTLGIVTGDKSGGFKAAEIDAVAQAQGAGRKPPEENRIDGNIAVLNGERPPPSSAFTDLLPAIVEVISGKDPASKSTVLEELLQNPDINQVVAMQKPYHQFGDCTYDCYDSGGGRLLASAKGGDRCSTNPPFRCQMICCKSEHVGLNKSGTCVPAVYHKPANFPCAEASPLPQPVACDKPKEEHEKCYEGKINNEKKKDELIEAAKADCRKYHKGWFDRLTFCTTQQLLTHDRPLREKVGEACPLGSCCPSGCGEACCDAQPSPAPNPPEETADPGEEPVSSNPIKEDPVVSIPELMQSAAPGPHT